MSKALKLVLVASLVLGAIACAEGFALEYQEAQGSFSGVSGGVGPAGMGAEGGTGVSGEGGTGGTGTSGTGGTGTSGTGGTGGTGTSGTGGTGVSGTGGTGTSGTGAAGTGAAGTGGGTCNPPCTGLGACCKMDGSCGSGVAPFCF